MEKRLEVCDIMEPLEVICVSDTVRQEDGGYFMRIATAIAAGDRGCNVTFPDGTNGTLSMKQANGEEPMADGRIIKFLANSDVDERDVFFFHSRMAAL